MTLQKQLKYAHPKILINTHCRSTTTEIPQYPKGNFIAEASILEMRGIT